MLVSFKSLPNFSRIWIFQSSRVFTNIELVEIKLKLDFFLNQWAAHGVKLETGHLTPYNRFIVIGLNESNQFATGCSIDSCVKFIKELELEYNIDLLDKMNVTFRIGETIDYVSLKEFRSLAKRRKVSLKTIVFNNLVLDKEQFEDLWEVPAVNSWHSHFMKI
jgi:predicted HTH domain antitoxin|tara:strand:+ start:2798 stop:3286 length:489 start_codon:yes stop_codon:yes gene_type:complete